MSSWIRDQEIRPVGSACFYNSGGGGEGDGESGERARVGEERSPWDSGVRKGQLEEGRR